ncbi:MAG: phosphoribosyl-ATP diphosphatase [Rhodospirillaceae bacterium]
MTDSNPDIPLSGLVLDELYDLIASRKGGDPAESYTAQLYARGTKKIAQKLGEEAVEAVIAATTRDRTETIRESADLIYHLLVTWADAGIVPLDVYNEIARRKGLSGLAEKSARKGGSAT